MQLGESKNSCIRENSSFFNWRVFVLFLLFLGIVGAIFFQTNCPARCKVALFSSSNEVNEIVGYAINGGVFLPGAPVPNAFSLPSVKNKPPVPSVATASSDGQGNLHIASTEGLIVLLVRKDNGGRLRCTIVRPNIDSKWCTLAIEK